VQDNFVVSFVLWFSISKKYIVFFFYASLILHEAKFARFFFFPRAIRREKLSPRFFLRRVDFFFRFFLFSLQVHATRIGERDVNNDDGAHNKIRPFLGCSRGLTVSVTGADES